MRKLYSSILGTLRLIDAFLLLLELLTFHEFNLVSLSLWRRTLHHTPLLDEFLDVLLDLFDLAKHEFQVVEDLRLS
jgi:hypothetical protein